MTIYARNFTTNEVVSTKSLRISKFFPSNLKYLIQKKVPDGKYILGVTYKSGDSQICISGHPKENETIQEGAERELCEELSLKPKKDLVFCYQKDINHFCFIDISSTEISLNVRKNDLRDLKERAIICVFGDENQILEYLKNVEYDLNNTDQIQSIWSTTKEIILNYLIKKSNFLII